jgi:hypothetical protein
VFAIACYCAAPFTVRAISGDRLAAEPRAPAPISATGPGGCSRCSCYNFLSLVIGAIRCSPATQKFVQLANMRAAF